MQNKNRPRYGRGIQDGFNRREFLTGLLAAGATAAVPFALVTPKKAHADDFPSAIPLYRADFKNWCGELDFKQLLTCAPVTPGDVAAVAGWAAQHGYSLRPRGAMHNWSPLSLNFDTTQATPVIMADTTQHLNRMEMVSLPQPAVRVETGATLEELMTFLEKHGYGFTAVPAVGNITVGGALAIDAHGCAVPAAGEAALPGQTYGTLSNRILSLTAVVWDGAASEYVLRSFSRSDPEAGALLVSLGRAFITEVTLTVEPNQNLRCQSYVDIPATEMFAAPGSGGRTIESFLRRGGRIEAIWYPFTDKPWLKVWSISPQRPLLSRPVFAPYNYPFTDTIPDPIPELVEQIMNGNPSAAPLLGQASYAVTVSGLAATLGYDLWGKSKNLLIWLRETTLRVHHTSFVVLTRRDRVQRVFHEFIAAFVAKRDAYRALGKYPNNMPIELRVTGLDKPADTGMPGAQPALLSAALPHPDHPEWDTAVWLSMATLPGTPDLYEFGREMERWVLGNYKGGYACARPEWSKGWAYTDSAAWSDPHALSRYPDSFQVGAQPRDGWNAAVGHLDTLDPYHVFSNSFLDGLLV
jgi:FAD/FMN-containing dehydrogenase